MRNFLPYHTESYRYSPENVKQCTRCRKDGGSERTFDVAPESSAAARIGVARGDGYLIAAAGIAGVVFLAGLWLPVHGSIAALYAIVVLVVALSGRHGFVIPAGIVCIVLAILGYALSPVTATSPNALADLTVGAFVIAGLTVFTVRIGSRKGPVLEQTRLLELTHDTVIVCDAEGRITYWNEGAEKLYGWSRQQAVGANCHDLLRTGYPSADVVDSLAASGMWAGEVTRQRRDGSRVLLASRWLVCLDHLGQRSGIIETSSDLTAERRADDERRISEERYEAIFNASPVAIWESDWSCVLAHFQSHGVTPRTLRTGLDQLSIVRNLGCTRIANKATAELFGTGTPELMKGKTFVAHYTPSTELALAEIFATFLEGGQMREVETQFRTAAGTIIDVLWRATMVPGESAWSRVLITAVDVTDRNEARAQLEQASADLAHASRVATLGQLSASIAHEVSQPLAAIKTYADSAIRWLTRPQPDMAEVAICLDGVVANTTRASDTLARVRSMARNEAPVSEAFDLAGLIAESVRIVQREANAHGAYIRELIEPGLSLAFANRVQMQQVTVNLMLNAVQAMNEVDGRAREVVVSARTHQQQMMIVEVRDNGSGIALDNPNGIFQPFRTTKASGLGMGLAICRSIVEAHGGSIRAENNSDHGAAVSFTVPSEVRAADVVQRRPAGDHEPVGRQVATMADDRPVGRHALDRLEASQVKHQAGSPVRVIATKVDRPLTST